MHHPEDERWTILVLDEAHYGGWLSSTVADARSFFVNGQVNFSPNRGPCRRDLAEPPVAEYFDRHDRNCFDMGQKIRNIALARYHFKLRQTVHRHSNAASNGVTCRSRMGMAFAAGTLLCSAWCHSGINGLHSGK